MEYSDILKTLIERTKELGSIRNKPVTCDLFVGVVLRALADFKRGDNEFTDTEASREELRRITEVMGEYKVDYVWAADALMTASATDNIPSGLSSLKVTLLKVSASAYKAERVLDTAAVLSFILDNPSDAVSEFIVRFASSPSQVDKKLQAYMQILRTQGTVGSPEQPVFPPPDTPSAQSWLERMRQTDAAAPAQPVRSDILQKAVESTLRLQKFLLDSVYGQDGAINALVSGYFQAELTSATQENRSRPRATFLFAGPPGTGKTFLAEQAASALKLPFKRFDMSEYADKEENLAFCGSDKVYKNGKEGNVTSFVSRNPKCVLLFDEIEKAHLTVIHLFLQMLDAGRLRDNFTDREVSFTNAIIILTTNAGKSLYEDPTVPNLSAVPRKVVLKALSEDRNPTTGDSLFPSAICSRFSAGNVVMFNRLEAHHLLTIANKELDRQASAFAKAGVSVERDKNVPYAIMFAEGANADARTVSGRTTGFIYKETFELFRLLESEKLAVKSADIENIRFKVELSSAPEKVRALFSDEFTPEALIFATEKLQNKCEKALKRMTVHYAQTVSEAKKILRNHKINIILCDICCNARNKDIRVLNLDDIESEGRDLFDYVRTYLNVPLYLLTEKEDEISPEEMQSLSEKGARGQIGAYHKPRDLENKVLAECSALRQQEKLTELARANKVVSYQTSQTLSSDGKKATIRLYDLRLETAVDSGDGRNVLSDVSKPETKFDDVVGANDAKEELKYFVEYLKNPAKFANAGVRAPRGVLLYGPPGTGKTKLAKAMAGESDVTFVNSAGNEFLKGRAESVHDLFNTARKYAPSILFIDEIDAVAKERGALTDFNSDVLTAFLTEMDGFKSESDKPVFVLAATNYTPESGTSRSLDPALVRRFDRSILVDMPSRDERIRFLRMSIEKNKNLKLSDEQVESIGMRAAGMSLAELESVIEFAFRSALRTKDGIADDAVFEEAFETFTGGEEKKWSESTLERTARHEAGHALLCKLSGETPSYLTIVARGSHGGYMQSDREDKKLYTKKELLNNILTALGGRAAELVYYGDCDGVSTGASGDLASATKTAEQMICCYGMDETVGLGYIDIAAAVQSPYYTVIRERVNAVLNEQMKRAVELISANRAAIDKLTSALLKNNHLKGAEIDDLLSDV